MKSISATLWLWKLAIARLTIHCLIVTGTTYQGAMGNQHWSDLDGDSRFKLILGIIMANLATVAAFLDKTSAKLASGSTLPPDTGDTVLISRTSRSATTLTPAVAATKEAPATPETIATTDTVTTVTTPKKDS